MRALSQHCAVFWLPLVGFLAVAVWLNGAQFIFAREMALGLLAWGGGFVIVPAGFWGFRLADLQERSLGGVSPSDLSGFLGVVLSGLLVGVGLARTWSGGAALVEGVAAALLAWVGTRAMSLGES
jgi:hypothetical protein